MDIKYIIGLLILLRVHVGQCISKSTIVYFRCCNCAPQANDCCVGALILSNVAITTAFCTDNCQKAIIGKYKNVTIVRRFSHQHYRNYLMEDLRHKVQRNDVGLVSFSDFGSSPMPFLRLSAVIIDAAFGLTGLIPVIDNMRPRLVRTIVQRCRKHTRYSMGFVICTLNKYLSKSNLPCQQHQGIPLLVDGKIIGLTGFMDTTMCNTQQKYFLAVGPSLSWIRAIVTSVASLRNKINTNKVAVLRGRESNPPQEQDSVRPPETISNTTVTTLSVMDVDSNLLSGINTTTTFIENTNLSTIDITTTQSTTPQKIWSSDENVSDNEKSAILNPFNKTNLQKVGNLTNAMDWFNNNVRNKLNTTVPLLIFTTPYFVHEENFQDLT